MVITKSFDHTFYFNLRVKLRRVLRHSVKRYFLAAVMITFARCSFDSIPPSSTLWYAIVLDGLVVFSLLMGCILLILTLAAYLQTRRALRLDIAFSERELVVTEVADGHAEEPVTQGWDWIASADNARNMLYLTLDQSRLSLCLPKSELSEEEYQLLHGWLLAQGKLPEKDKL